ncbi:MAG TPA: sigma 54-interacting transcriptional regulator, partial [Bacteroidota bacterium]|nr:sigma 54-interacting transcriptional regulator [Bacteroidota bacterium]
MLTTRPNPVETPPAADQWPGIDALLEELSARFINMPAKEIDRGIRWAQQLICETLGLDRSTLWQPAPENGLLTATHIWARPEFMLPGGVVSQYSFPWATGKIMSGEILRVAEEEDFPVEAVIDRESFRRIELKSTLGIPLQVEGAIIGALTFGSCSRPRLWENGELRYLQVVAQIFANALDRIRSGRLLQESEARLAMAIECADVGIWILESGTGRVWATPKSRELLAVSTDEELDFLGFVSGIDVEGRERLRHAILASENSNEVFKVELRLPGPAGNDRWILCRGRRQVDESGQTRFMGVVSDITWRIKAEEQLRQSYEEVKRLTDKLNAESEYLRHEIKLIHNRNEIIGKSEAIDRVLQLVDQVSKTDASVLITGETGTGKELVARAIHARGERKQRPLVKVDCASLPAGLIESELFGRERGAYTGAMTRQIGRFQVADKATIFLDEIGELPKETQVKLLRVLQEGSFEALGSPKTVTVNVRVIAATNRDLAADVRAGRFREDLYYRLNVFPIEVPPLRNRREDIPMLVWSFVEKFSREMRKEIRHIPKETMDALVRYHWPGNVRELKNLLEQAFIISPSDVLTVRFPHPSSAKASSSQSLRDIERHHILSVLDQTHWHIRGGG